MIVLKVDLVVKAGAEEKCREFMSTMQQHTRQEPGCLMYVGHQSTQNPRHFMFYEQYKDQAALDAHRNAPYFKEYVTNGLGPLLEQRSAELYKEID